MSIPCKGAFGKSPPRARLDRHGILKETSERRTQKYPNSRIKALSNSTTQKIHIDSAAKERGLTNLEVFTGDVKEFEFDSSKRWGVSRASSSTCLRVLNLTVLDALVRFWIFFRFDRVLSIEMFEHMKASHLGFPSDLSDPS